MNEDVKVLCVDDETNVLRSLERLFFDADFELLAASSVEEGLAMLEKEWPVQVVVSDYRMPGMTGIDFLKQVYERWPETIRIVLSGYADTASVVDAINEGQIYKFIPKPWNDDELKVAIDKAIETYFLRMRNMELADELKESNEELRILNENLETLVRERTEELLFRNRVLAGVQNIFHQLPCGVVGLDGEGLIAQTNRRAEEIFGGSGLFFPGGVASVGLPADLADFVNRIRDHHGVSSRKIRINGCEYLVKGGMFSSADGQSGIILVVDDCPCSTNGNFAEAGVGAEKENG